MQLVVDVPAGHGAEKALQLRQRAHVQRACVAHAKPLRELVHVPRGRLAARDVRQVVEEVLPCLLVGGSDVQIWARDVVDVDDGLGVWVFDGAEAAFVGFRGASGGAQLGVLGAGLRWLDRCGGHFDGLEGHFGGGWVVYGSSRSGECRTFPPIYCDRMRKLERRGHGC